MKIVFALCGVFLLGSVWADEDGGQRGTEESDKKSGSTFTQSMCPTSKPWSYGNVMEIGNRCARLAATQSGSHTSNNNNNNTTKTLDDHRDFFRGYCARRAMVSACLNETALNMEVCRNDVYMKTFEIYSGHIEAILEVGCVGDGEKFATLWHELSEFFRLKQKSDSIKECNDRFEAMFEDLLMSEVDMSSKLYLLHGELNASAECVYKIDLEPSLRDGLKSFTDVIINGMKCIHPVDGTLVPCVSIDVGIVKTSNICDVRSFGTGMSLYDVLEEDSGTHLMDFLNYDDDDVGSDDNIRHHIQLECKHRVDLPILFKKVRIVSEACLNATQHEEFLLYGDSIKGGYDVACRDDGKRFADVIVEVFRLRRTGQGHAVWDCVDVVKAARKMADDQHDGSSSSKNMRFYHELESFKTCLVGKLHGDQTSVDAATSLIDEILRKVKCVDHAVGATVFCETLVNAAT